MEHASKRSLAPFMRSLFLAGLILASYQSYAGVPLVIEREDFEAIEMHRQGTFLIGEHGLETVEDVIRKSPDFKPLDPSGRNVPSNKVHWLKFSIENRIGKDFTVILMHNVAYTSFVHVYELKNGKANLIEKTGTAFPYKDRIIKFRKPSIPLAMSPGTHEYLIRVQHQGMQSHYFKIIGLNPFYNYAVIDIAVVCFVCGIFAFCIIYNIFVYLQLRERFLLFYTLHCMASFACYFFLNGFVGSIATSLSDRAFIMFWTLMFAAFTTVLGYFFAKDYLKLSIYAPTLDKILTGFTYLYIAVIGLIFLEYLTSIKFKAASMLCAIIPIFTSPLMIIASIRCFIKGYKPAIYFTIAWLPLIALSNSSLLVTIGVIPWIEFADLFGLIGGSIEACLLSLAIGYRVRMETDGLHSDLEEHIKNLDALVEQKTGKIRYILDNVRVGIFKINADRSIDSEYSRVCLDIFGREEIKGIDTRQLLYPGRESSDLTEYEHIGLSTLDLLIGESEITLEFNCHCLPTEVVDSSGSRIIQLEWSGIIVGGWVTGFLVTARDVTYLRQLEMDQRKTAEEIDVLKNVVKFGKDRLINYFNAEQAVLTKMVRLANKIPYDRNSLSKDISTVLRGLHTIKGNARTYGFNRISSLAHNYESKLNASGEPGVLAYLTLEAVNAIDEIFDEYLDFIGRHFPLDRVHGTDKAVNYANRLTEMQFVDPEAGPVVLEISSFLKSLGAYSLFSIIDPIVRGLPSIAMSLGKEIPDVHFDIEVSHVFVKKQYLHQMESVFTQLFRNSIDHGIQRPEEREQLGKNRIGRIDIRISKTAQGRTLTFGDDGRGLAINKIYDKAGKMGLLPQERIPTVREIASYIFVPGFSSRSEVTEISGRGAGMDAVRETLAELNAEIHISFNDPIIGSLACAKNTEYVGFYFEIVLPEDLFV